MHEKVAANAKPLLWQAFSRFVRECEARIEYRQVWLAHAFASFIACLQTRASLGCEVNAAM